MWSRPARATGSCSTSHRSGPRPTAARSCPELYPTVRPNIPPCFSMLRPHRRCLRCAQVVRLHWRAAKDAVLSSVKVSGVITTANLATVLPQSKVYKERYQDQSQSRCVQIRVQHVSRCTPRTTQPVRRRYSAVLLEHQNELAKRGAKNALTIAEVRLAKVHTDSVGMSKLQRLEDELPAETLAWCRAEPRAHSARCTSVHGARLTPCTVHRRRHLHGACCAGAGWSRPTTCERSSPSRSGSGTARRRSRQKRPPTTLRQAGFRSRRCSD